VLVELFSTGEAIASDIKNRAIAKVSI
jgi:hypothetical protein